VAVRVHPPRPKGAGRIYLIETDQHYELIVINNLIGIAFQKAGVPVPRELFITARDYNYRSDAYCEWTREGVTLRLEYNAYLLRTN
jgi:hypothetical protein